jgi:hypothetical protein
LLLLQGSFGWVVERTERIKDGPHGAVWMIGKLDHAQFDHLVGGDIQSGGFDVE